MKQLNFPVFAERPRWQRWPVMLWKIARYMRGEPWDLAHFKVACSAAWRFRGVKLRIR